MSKLNLFKQVLYSHFCNNHSILGVFLVWAVFTIFFCDLKRMTQAPFFYLRRFAFLGCIIIFFFSAFGGARFPLSSMGKRVMATIAWTIYVLLVVFAPRSASTAISDEVEKKTLGLLVMTRLSYRNVVLGKYVQLLFITCLNAIASLPIFLFCVSLGGISSAQIISIHITLFGILMVGLAIGILCSVLFNAKSAQFVAFLLMIGYLGLSYFLPMGSSTTALRKAISGQDIFYSYYSLLWQIFFACGFLNAAVSLLPVMYDLRNKEAVNIKMNRVIQKATVLKTKKKSKAIGQPVIGNPVAWRDYHMIHGGRVGLYLRIVICVIAILFVAFIVLQSRNINTRFWLLATIFSAIIFVFSLVGAGLRSFTKEMESKSWQILLTTKLSNREIVQGKMKGAFKNAQTFLPIVVIFSSLLLLTALKKKNVSTMDCLYVVSLIGWIIAFVINVFCCSVFCSFYYRTRRRAGNYFGLFMFLWYICLALSGIIYGRSMWKGISGMIINVMSIGLHVFLAKSFYIYVIRNLREKIDFD